MLWRLLAVCLIACALPAAAQFFNLARVARPGETTFANAGQPWPFLGSTIYAENYDAGGSAVAFNVSNLNTLPACQALGYRADAANLQASSDGPAYQIGCAVVGNSYQYIANVLTPSPCPCRVVARVGSSSAGGSWALYIDGALIVTVSTPNTGSYTAMQGVNSTAFNLLPGNHVVRWQAASGDGSGYAGSMSSFQFVQGSAPTLSLSFNPPSPSIPATSALGTVVAQIVPAWSDGSHFTGTVAFALPYVSDGGCFSIDGNLNLITACDLSGDGGTVQNVTLSATQ